MKNFKDFIKDYEDGNFTYSDKTFAYAAYCQGYAEAKNEIVVFDDGKGNYFPLVPNVPAPHFPYDKMRNLSEEERKAAFARQVEELKQNPTSVLHAIAMQKAAEKVEEK